MNARLGPLAPVVDLLQQREIEYHRANVLKICQHIAKEGFVGPIALTSLRIALSLLESAEKK